MCEKHIPVLLDECLEGLGIRPDGIYVDGTLGRAGHAYEIASRLTTGKLIGIDRDQTAIEAAKKRLGQFGERVSLVHGNFRDIEAILAGLGTPQVDGMLFDLGVSSPQLDNAQRGFSYMADAPLDMRMDQTAALTADEVVNTWAEGRLRQILYDYGEERYAPRIAKAICTQRETGAIQTTGQLVDIIRSAMPVSALREKQHPAKRTFQAIRIAVNDELGAVEDMLEAATACLAPGGRLAVISFHSLEDRLVKNAISRREKGCTCPRDFPVCVCGFVPTLKNMSRKAILPTAEEIEQNPRARSAKLRVAERI
ncbi:MAG: 16S rRNA (cytosine(1402)-N(4))-methyltransferase RsmH [Oscillospiraceae bacterium]|nr:16S rRNA (cytosine(1402)-N(4))-methyltransferase RsmH [Oscillospiraceae bacterium]